jgi:hypothetical protein
MCHRQVFDLNSMDDAQRLGFLASCSGEVCISYKAPLRIALAAMAASAAMAVPLAAAAGDVTQLEIVVGGMKDPAHTELVRDTAPEDANTPVAPVIYESAFTRQASATPPPAAQVSANLMPTSGAGDVADKKALAVTPRAAS